MHRIAQINILRVGLFLTALISFQMIFFNTIKKNTVINDSFFFNMQKGYLTPLVTDFIWLNLTKQVKDDADQIFNSTKIIALTDPNFFDGINYGALYLAAVLDRPDDALQIINTAQSKNSDIRLSILELNVLIIYKKDFIVATQLAKKLLTASKIKNQKLSSDNFLLSLLVFGASPDKIKAQNIQDLEFLLKIEQNNKRKIKIKEKLDVLLQNRSS